MNAPMIVFDRRPDGVRILHSSFGNSRTAPDGADIRIGDTVTLRTGRVRYDVRVSELRPNNLLAGTVDDVDLGDPVPSNAEDERVLLVGATVEFGMEVVHACMHE